MKSLIILFFFLLITPQEYKVRLGSVVPKDSPWETGLKEYINHVEEKSGNAIKFRTYLGGQLGGEVEMVKSIAMGTLEAGAFSTAAIAEALSIPELLVFELPFLFKSDDEVDYIMDKVMFNQMSGLLAKKGLILIMWGTNGWRNFGTKEKPIVKPSDLKGLKMRSQESEVYVNFYKATGATPVPISTPDVLVALKTSMVDGFDQTPIFSVSTGWISTIKYFTLSKHIYQPGAIVFSKRFFDKLPANLKSIVSIPVVREELQNKSRSYVRTDDAEVSKSIEKDFGVKIIELTEQQRNEFKKVSQPVYTSLEKKVSPNILKLINAELAKYRQSKK